MGEEEKVVDEGRKGSARGQKLKDRAIVEHVPVGDENLAITPRKRVHDGELVCWEGSTVSQHEARRERSKGTALRTCSFEERRNARASLSAR